MDDDERYVDEFGQRLPRWQPLEPHMRGRHSSFGDAAKAAYNALVTVKNPFVDYLANAWKTFFPDMPARPGRYEDGILFLYVKNAPMLFALRPKLAAVKRRIAKLPGAPKRLDVKLEIHK